MPENHSQLEDDEESQSSHSGSDGDPGNHDEEESSESQSYSSASSYGNKGYYDDDDEDEGVMKVESVPKEKPGRRRGSDGTNKSSRSGSSSRSNQSKVSSRSRASKNRSGSGKSQTSSSNSNNRSASQQQHQQHQREEDDASDYDDSSSDLPDDSFAIDSLGSPGSLGSHHRNYQPPANKEESQQLAPFLADTIPKQVEDDGDRTTHVKNGMFQQIFNPVAAPMSQPKKVPIREAEEEEEDPSSTTNDSCHDSEEGMDQLADLPAPPPPPAPAQEMDAESSSKTEKYTPPAPPSPAISSRYVKSSPNENSAAGADSNSTEIPAQRIAMELQTPIASSHRGKLFHAPNSASALPSPAIKSSSDTPTSSTMNSTQPTPRSRKSMEIKTPQVATRGKYIPPAMPSPAIQAYYGISNSKNPAQSLQDAIASIAIDPKAVIHYKNQPRSLSLDDDVEGDEHGIDEEESEQDQIDRLRKELEESLMEEERVAAQKMELVLRINEMKRKTLEREKEAELADIALQQANAKRRLERHRQGGEGNAAKETEVSIDLKC